MVLRSEDLFQRGAPTRRRRTPSERLSHLHTPERDYETNGFVPNVVFPCATLADADTGRIAIYYGAADTYTGIAFTQVDELIDYIKANSDVF